MKKHENRIAAGIIIGFLILMSVVPAMAEEPSIALSSRQSAPSGSYERISWYYIGSFEPNVTLELFKDGILNRTIISDTFIGNVDYYWNNTPYGHGYYYWAIPISLEVGTYQIKITARTTTDQEVTNVTDIEITTPTEQGCRNCHYSVSTNANRHHSLTNRGEYVCADCHPVINGSIFIDRNCIDCHNGTAFWAQPSTNPGEPHLDPNLIVTNPNGDTWDVGTMQTIRWNYTGNVGPTAKIELLKDGALIQTIRPESFFGHDYECSYNWTVPQLETGSYQIKVTMSNSSSNGSAVYANTSDVYILRPNIIVTSPMTGDNWVRDTTQTIRWNYVGNLGSYAKIELLEQGMVDQTWNNVPQANGVGSLEWAIPSQFEVSTYQVRVSAGGYSNTTGNFNIVRR